MHASNLPETVRSSIFLFPNRARSACPQDLEHLFADTPTSERRRACSVVRRGISRIHLRTLDDWINEIWPGGKKPTCEQREAMTAFVVLEYAEHANLSIMDAAYAITNGRLREVIA
ncbi:hypothetical protein HY970_02105 [Candidatus Kaiserbacteria bacterium]|nr:hypothetical protein [Candidatus Kaiserbacteria bacterium]